MIFIVDLTTGSRVNVSELIGCPVAADADPDELLREWDDLCCDTCAGEGCPACQHTGYSPDRHADLVAECLKPEAQ